MRRRASHTGSSSLGRIRITRNALDRNGKQMISVDVPILTRGLQFQPVTMSAEDQQIIDQKKLNNQAIAAIFGVPGYPARQCTPTPARRKAPRR